MITGNITQLTETAGSLRPVFHAPRRQRPATKVQRLHPDAKLPTRAKSGDAGWDVYALSAYEIPPGRIQLVALGIALEPPPGYWYKAFSRSSTAVAEVSVEGGVIDNGYRGHVKILLRNHGRDAFLVRPGDRVAQLIEMRLPECDLELADTLADTERGGGGFGSTGR